MVGTIRVSDISIGVLAAAVLFYHYFAPSDLLNAGSMKTKMTVRTVSAVRRCGMKMRQLFSPKSTMTQPPPPSPPPRTTKSANLTAQSYTEKAHGNVVDKENSPADSAMSATQDPVKEPVQSSKNGGGDSEKNTAPKATMTSTGENTSPAPVTTTTTTPSTTATATVNGAIDKKEESPEKKNQPAEASTPKLSGAELKKRAKAEKAARRAKEKQDREQQQQQHQQGGAAGEASKKGGAGKQLQDAGKPGAKATSGGAPVTAGPGAGRPTQRRGSIHVPAVEAKKKKKAGNENIVAVFGHLPWQSRRAGIAGVGKEIHPAVVALGMQLRDYVICGSSARCVATLLALRRVCSILDFPCFSTVSVVRGRMANAPFPSLLNRSCKLILLLSGRPSRVI